MLIEDAGFDNLLSDDPLYAVIGGDLGQELDDDQAAILSTFLGEMQQLSTAEIWNVDHFMALFGMSDPRFVRAMVNALLRLPSRALRPRAVDGPIGAIC